MEIDGGDHDDLLIGGSDIDAIEGGMDTDVLGGAGGADELRGEGGKDYMDGGPGNDEADYENDSGVTVDLRIDGYQQTGGAGEDLLTAIEELAGSDGNDTLIGDGEDNDIDGRNGLDSISGNGGDDKLYGGGAADTVSYADAPVGRHRRPRRAASRTRRGRASTSSTGVREPDRQRLPRRPDRHERPERHRRRRRPGQAASASATRTACSSARARRTTRTAATGADLAVTDVPGLDVVTDCEQVEALPAPPEPEQPVDGGNGGDGQTPPPVTPPGDGTQQPGTDTTPSGGPSTTPTGDRTKPVITGLKRRGRRLQLRLSENARVSLAVRRGLAKKAKTINKAGVRGLNRVRLGQAAPRDLPRPRRRHRRGRQPHDEEAHLPRAEVGRGAAAARQRRVGSRPMVTVITGASSGIGAATARAVAAARPGGGLVLVARREAQLRTLATELGATYVAVDLVGEDAPARVRAHVEEHHDGRLDLLVNNAGASWRSTFADGGYENVRRHMEVNFDAPVRLTEALLPLLRASAPSAIVNVSSVAGRVARGGAGSYSAAKFALAGWSDALFQEEREHGVHVGLVLPGFVKTEGFPAAELTGKRADELGRLHRREGRRGDPRRGPQRQGRALRPAPLEAHPDPPRPRARPPPPRGRGSGREGHADEDGRRLHHLKVPDTAMFTWSDTATFTCLHREASRPAVPAWGRPPDPRRHLLEAVIVEHRLGDGCVGDSVGRAVCSLRGGRRCADARDAGS